MSAADPQSLVANNYEGVIPFSKFLWPPTSPGLLALDPVSKDIGKLNIYNLSDLFKLWNTCVDDYWA